MPPLTGELLAAKGEKINLAKANEIDAASVTRVTVLVETMNPTMVKRMKEKSIEGSNAKFIWGVKNGEELVKLLPNFRLVEEHSLAEGMAEFIAIFKLLSKIKPVSNISNRIVVLESGSL